MSGIVNSTGAASGVIGTTVGTPAVVIKKVHYFESTTKTSGNSTAGNQFTFTSAFIPLDPVNNSFLVDVRVPSQGNANYWAGFGLRFNSGTTDVDFMGMGVNYQFQDTFGGGYRMTGESIGFGIAANALIVGTHTVTFRTQSNDSQSAEYNPNSSTTDAARLVTATRSTLTITEYKN